MSEEENKAPDNSDAIAELQEQLDSSRKSVAALEAKQVEILDEAKRAKKARNKAETDAQAAIDEKARANGDHEQLYKSSEAAREKTQGELDKLLGDIATEKQSYAAIKIATEIADGDNAGLLSEFITKRLRFADGEIKVTDMNGNLTVSSLDDLKNEFKGNAKYSALLKGNQSSGGGAAGGNNSGGAAKQMSRSDFDGLNPVAAAKFMKEGGSLTQ